MASLISSPNTEPWVLPVTILVCGALFIGIAYWHALRRAKKAGRTLEGSISSVEEPEED
ncbi:MAG: hypothetical protein ABIJ23_03875 [Candidatus Magasanikbacteria bacterium]